MNPISVKTGCWRCHDRGQVPHWSTKGLRAGRQPRDATMVACPNCHGRPKDPNQLDIFEHMVAISKVYAAAHDISL